MTLVNAPLTPNRALQLAVEKIGSQSATARLLGLTQGAVSRWLKGGKALPAEHVRVVEAETGISRHQLRPDIYPQDPTPPSIHERGAMEPAR